MFRPKIRKPTESENIIKLNDSLLYSTKIFNKYWDIVSPWVHCVGRCVSTSISPTKRSLPRECSHAGQGGEWRVRLGLPCCNIWLWLPPVWTLHIETSHHNYWWESLWRLFYSTANWNFLCPAVRRFPRPRPRRGQLGTLGASALGIIFWVNALKTNIANGAGWEIISYVQTTKPLKWCWKKTFSLIQKFPDIHMAAIVSLSFTKR